ncbi:hypothetical protein OSJ77_08810 [Phyllobacterium sp. 0TCS1.6C]|uniref:hypothetical protein n=1 Tax=unclassified Phyllobacterium TaxID=2638441 RepID=UPI002263E07E|nr:MULTISPECIES: hypothetical protein [unclassified Phyllobacterium]MCX8280291.1 hypothetical protein [Phyllobacterium sp. 0TCS1.6C]MCX8294148.1 hypothetical protein [Phyllobacterium sp. 0TCS1.6A]
MTIAELHKIPLQAVPKDVFSLSAEAFVDAWAVAFNLTEDDLGSEERHNLVRAIKNGTNRLKVIDALDAASKHADGRKADFEANAVRREPDQFALLESFRRFAPDDDVAFIRYVFSRICGRDPSDKERLTFEFDLRRGIVGRDDVIRKIVTIARRDGVLALWDTLDEPDTAPAVSRPDASSARILPAGLSYDLEGRQTLVFVREMPGSGWMIGPELMRQPVNVVDGGWSVSPGWLLAGPKRSLDAGAWNIQIDLVQDAKAKLAIQLVANSGLDILQDLIVSGPFAGNLCVDIRPEHRFIELRLRVVEGPAETGWLRLRNISMVRASADRGDR